MSSNYLDAVWQAFLGIVGLAAARPCCARAMAFGGGRRLPSRPNCEAELLLLRDTLPTERDHEIVVPGLLDGVDQAADSGVT